jgi:hypothetical protein
VLGTQCLALSLGNLPRLRGRVRPYRLGNAMRISPEIFDICVGRARKLGGKPVQITGGVRYWADNPEGGAEGWGGRLVVTYLFPKKG